VTVADLKRWNNMRSNRIKVGQRLSLGPVGVAKAPAAVVVAEKQAPAPTKSVDTTQYGAYTIQSGDTLGEIAERHNMSTRELRRLNRIGSRSRIRAGTQLKVRGKAVAAPSPVVEAVKPVENLWSERVALDVAEKRQGKRVIYRVKSGDTLWDISKLYKVSPEQIQDWNNMKRPIIKPGQELTIRVSS
jgi:LysM repeat protein